MTCQMSLKLHLFYSHLDFFGEVNLRNFNKEHGERFHQDIEPTKRRYQGTVVGTV